MHRFPADLLNGYKSFMTERYANEKGRYKELAGGGQNPTTMVIACCDSRREFGVNNTPFGRQDSNGPKDTGAGGYCFGNQCPDDVINRRHGYGIDSIDTAGYLRICSAEINLKASLPDGEARTDLYRSNFDPVVVEVILGGVGSLRNGPQQCANHPLGIVLQMDAI